MDENRVLVIGCGNPSRGDDGLGPALISRLEASGTPGLTLESDYQLSLEHAALVAGHGTVIFVDAAADAAGAFYFRALEASPLSAFTSHGVTAGQVLYLARSCFGAAPDAYVLGIRARVLDRFGEGLSPEAEAALGAAEARLLRFLERRCAGGGDVTTADSHRAAGPGSTCGENRNARR